MIPLLVAAALPALFWEHGPETGAMLKRAGVERVCVPKKLVAAWSEAGFDAFAGDPSDPAYEHVKAPGVQWRINVASATHTPWIDANGWKFLRGPKQKFWEDVPAGLAALAAAEAFAYGANAVLRIAPSDLETMGAMLLFLGRTGNGAMPPLGDVCVADDGSAVTGEALNMLARRNLLFRIAGTPDSGCELNIRIGSPKYPLEAARNPSRFAAQIRRELTDEKRLLHIFGTDVVLGHLAGHDGKVRLHLLNYSGRKVEGLRIRLRGVYTKAAVAAPGREPAGAVDILSEGGVTEFSLLEMGVYAIVDLSR
jgi:hypothetical protein